MLKFIRWFMKLLKPESTGFVRNIQVDSNGSKGQKQDQAAGKRHVNDKDLVYWIPSGKIIEIKKNSQGLTTDIKIASGVSFIPVKYTGKLKTSQKKQGLSRVSHHIEISLAENDDLKQQLEDIIARGSKITILHINRFGDGFLYGEDKGLGVEKFENSNLVLEGIEDNVFYELTRECIQKAVPKTE